MLMHASTPVLRRTDPLGVKNPKITQKIYKNYIFEVFQNYQKNTQKLHLPFCCFQNYQKNMQKIHFQYQLRREVAQFVSFAQLLHICLVTLKTANR